MKKFIVTTTIQPPTDATKIFASMTDWTMIIVGDKKTPHELYEKSSNWLYMSPEYQDKKYHALSEAIGWNKIMRRNLGFVEAYRLGADVVASIDDDNIPYADWGKDLAVGQEIEVDVYINDAKIIDPMKLTNHKELWHRGYPIDRLYEAKKIEWFGKDQKRKVEIQAGLWDGDPDVDALCRYLYSPTDLRLVIDKPFTTKDGYLMPFNSQNTFISRGVLPYYMMLPYVGRMDDIWGGYIAQFLFSPPVFTKATTYQERNPQSLEKNFQDELFGYKNTSLFTSFLLDGDYTSAIALLPEKTQIAWKEYVNSFRIIEGDNL